MDSDLQYKILEKRRGAKSKYIFNVAVTSHRDNTNSDIKEMYR